MKTTKPSLNQLLAPLSLSLFLTVFSAVASAETAEFKISGMTCGSCVKVIKGKVCGSPELSSCEVKVGSMVLKSKEGQTLDIEKFKSLVNATNEYKVTDTKTSK